MNLNKILTPGYPCRVSLKNVCPFGPAVWPAVADIYLYYIARQIRTFLHFGLLSFKAMNESRERNKDKINCFR